MIKLAIVFLLFAITACSTAPVTDTNEDELEAKIRRLEMRHNRP